MGEGCQVSVLRVLRFLGFGAFGGFGGFGRFKGWQTAGLDAHKKPLMCGLGGGLPSQRFKGFKVLKGLERLEGLEGLRAGKRQAGTPIRSH